ncbi:MAG: leucyl aminopeptidase family protein [Bifidobacteriaceae bacterium]|nr:leucyl aminopeptidase family protein [Bifidobacteriaceae bacterium]
MPLIRVKRGSAATSSQVKAQNCGLLAIGVGTGADGLEPGKGTAQAGARYGIDLAATALQRRFEGRPGTSQVIDLPVLHAADSPWSGLAPAIALLGVGTADPVAYRRAGARLAQVARGRGPVTATLGSESPACTNALVQGYLLGAYRPWRQGLAAESEAREGAPPAARVGELTLLGSHDRAAVQAGWVTAQAIIMARDLVNMPSSVKTPEWFEARARAWAKTRNSVSVEALEPEALARLGMGGILAVGAGAWEGPAADPARSPRLLVASHTPSAVKSPAHLVIVGKGVTFDTGGLDLKPTSSMVSMKTDMAGAAAALAAVLGAADLGLDIKVTAVAPLAQNSLGAASYRPSDVVTVYGGVTVEVGDTDAEGRLVLADGLAYAAANLKPNWLVDIATLTGAQKVALGHSTGALFATEDTLAARLEEEGAAAGEDWWRMPLVDAYGEALDSDNADISTVARAGTGAGAVTAALFLRRFAGGVPWAHLDMAGPARAAVATDLSPAGATGFGVGTLIRLAGRLA